MQTMFFEIRDRGTFIPALACRISAADGYLARRAGFGSPCVYLIHMTSGKVTSDPYAWNNRTMAAAHAYVEQNWDMLKNEDVIDVEFILGESFVKKISERHTG